MEISNGCGVTIQQVQCIFPECPVGTNNGKIIINAYIKDKQKLEYSIDGGVNFFTSHIFENLPPGVYTIIVQPLKNPECALEYGTVELPAPVCKEQCEKVDETCGTLLYPGDIVFVGFDNNIHFGTDRIVLTNVTDIKPGTAFTIANVIYEGGAALGQRTNKWMASGTMDTGAIASHKIVYIGKTTIPSGAVICFDLPSHDSGLGMLAQNFKINGIFSSDFCVSDNGNTSLPRVNISTKKPDALFILQGTWTFHPDHATLCGRVISGIQHGASWLTLGSGVPIPSRISRIHPQIACLSIQAQTSPSSTAAYFSLTGNPNPPLEYLQNATNFELWSQVEKAIGKNDLPQFVCFKELGEEEK